jgi:hypothetical protein
MSYLVRHAARRPVSVRRSRGARVDECVRLNRELFDGGAFVRVFVEDTSRRVMRFRSRPPVPRLRLRIGDCTKEVNLEFSVESAELRDNALFKMDTLLGALERFRHGLEVEAHLFAEREAKQRR